MSQTVSRLVGTVLDNRYLIVAPIARGGMSTVFRGIDRRLDRAVAVKVMHSEYAADPAFLQRFEFEARSVAGLKDPGLVAVYDQGVDGEHAFLVMELVRGGTLRELLRERGPMPPHAAVAVARPALRALAAAHRAGLVHRDVKPENVLISDDGEVKLADFGLVRAVAGVGSTSSSVMLGTAAYLSPEQVSTGRADGRSDVYAMGVLLYEMLTGRTPFEADTNLAIAYRRVQEDVPAPSTVIAGIPPEIDELVLRATERDPADRFDDAAAMGSALESTASLLHLPHFRVPAPRESAQHRAMAVPPPPAASEDPTAVHPAGPADPREPATEAIGPAPMPADMPGGPTHTRAYTTVEPRAGDAAGDGYGEGPAQGFTDAADGGDPPPEAGGYTPQAARRRRRSRRTTALWAAVIAVVTVLLGVGGWWFGSGRLTTVPDITGMDKAAVLTAVSSAGLSSSVQGVYSDDEPVDRVLGIDPSPGTRIARDSTVTVRVSLGAPSIPEPGTDSTVEAVMDRLRRMTLVPTRGPDEYSESVPRGHVVRIDPAPGTTVPVGSGVTVTASKGPPPVHVPDVAGKSPEDATRALADAKLTVSGQRTAFDPQIDGGKAIGTDPAADAVVDSGSAVTLVVSNAITVPDLEGKTPSEARTALSAAGIEMKDGGTVSDTDAKAGTVGRSSPAAGERVDPAHAVVTVYVSDTSKVPGLIGRTVGTARKTLSGMGLKVRVHQLIDGDGSLVIAQNPSSGSRVRPGSTVTLTAVP